MEPIKDNMQKYENYRVQMDRLKKALKSGFNLEAIFIEYAIIEDRLEAVLRTAGRWNVKEGKRPPSIEKKLSLVRKMAEEKKGLARKYFLPELLDQVAAWKERRNSLIHALMKQSLQPGEVRSLAEEGETVMKALKSKVDSYIRAKKKQDQAKTEVSHG